MGLFRRLGPTWLAIHAAVAGGLASAAVLDMCDRLASVRSASGMLSSLHGVVRLFAALANISTISLFATLL